MRMSMIALFVSSALMTAAMAEASAVATLVAADQLRTSLAALPNTAAVAGTGIGALTLSRLMRRSGRRRGLLAGYVIACLGALLATAAVSHHDVALLVAGMALLGVGNAGGLLSRYAAADLYPDRPGAAIGAVVWAGTVGAVGGPLLMMPAQNAAAAAGHDPMTGPFAFAVLAAIGALLVATATRPTRPTPTPGQGAAGRTAAATMITAQLVMVAVMTAAPLSMHMHGADLGAIGAMLSAHTFGMFALAPLSGWLLDRFGARMVMTGGLATLAGSAAFVAGSPRGTALTAALFLLGYGWNLAIVGGSGTLAGDGAAQGAVDALSWGASTLATTASSLLFVHGGYPLLATCAAATCALPLAGLLRRADVNPHYPPGVQSPVLTDAVALRPASASPAISESVNAKPVSDESSAVANTMPRTAPSGVISGPPELPLRTMDRIE
jgi:MFS family permease